jgi:predicted O-methyltransferase YrrM
MNPDILRERYEMLCAADTDVSEHLPTFVQAVNDVPLDRFVRVIELGVRYGVSTIAWLYALQDRGQLWSVDCSFPVEEPTLHVDLLNPQGPLGVCDHWLFLLGYDTWFEVISALPKKEVDIVFIDTNHVYEETMVELDLYHSRVRSGGHIFLHDTAIEVTGNATTPQPPFPVRTAMEEFCQMRNLRYTNVDNCYGLGTIYVD